MVFKVLLVFGFILFLSFTNGIPLKLSSDDNDLPQNPSDKSAYNFAIDISGFASVSTLQCVYQQGYDAVFVQVYSPSNGGSPNQNGIGTISLALSAKLGTEIYVTPSTSGKSGSQQFSEAYNAVKGQGINVQTIWLQVTSAINWPNNIQSNINLIESFVSQAYVNGISIGIYTNYNDWQQITGNYVDSYPLRLWYYNVYSNGPTGESPANFDDFRSFGQWNQPNAKQFAQNEGLCGITVNRNVYPSNGKKAENKKTTTKNENTVGGFV
uniref:Lysozyme n=1 Tax=Panagrolaimus superbus TaxID=310955 RepID=A0A914XZF3_9BILA